MRLSAIGIIALCAALYGCRQGTRGTEASPPSNAVLSAHPSGLQKAHALAPFVLSLDGPVPPDAGQVALIATLRKQTDAPIEIDLEISLPVGVTLHDGQQTERVVFPAQQIATTRRFVLSWALPLHEPIRVRAQLPVNAAAGAVAEREYPAPSSPTTSVVESTAAVLSIGGLPIAAPEEAVPVR